MSLGAEQDNLFDLSGRVAVITGGARGIGLSAARGMVRHGAAVVLFDVLEEDLKSAAVMLQSVGGTVITVCGSVTDLVEVEKLRVAAERLGTVSIVVNSAGIINRIDIEAMTTFDLDELWQVNVQGTVAVTQLFLPQMIAQGYGKVINLGSIGSVIGLERRTAYATTKGAVAMYTVSLASEVGKHGVRANVIAPGYVDTDMTGGHIWGEPARTQRLLERIPLGRFAATEDLAGTFVFLASRASDYITGQVLLVDGGWTAN